MTRIKEICDSWRIIDQYNIEYKYEYGERFIEIKDEDFKMILDDMPNKKYIMNLLYMVQH